MYSHSWFTNQIEYKIWLIIRNAAWAIFFVFIIAQPFNTNTVFANENVSLYIVKPPQVIEGKQYSWPIPVKSWGSSGKLSYTGQLPCGLYLDTSNNAISGTASKGMSQSSYFATVKLEDNFNKTECTYEFTVVYESNISIANTYWDVETNILLDGKSIDTKLNGGQYKNQYLPSGVSSNITVDIDVPSKYDKSIRYQPINRSIIVTNTSPNANFEYYPEYQINIVTLPEEVTQYYNDIYSKKNHELFINFNVPQWYKKDSVLMLNTPTEIPKTTGTEFKFRDWQLPSWNLWKENSFVMKVTGPGNLVANYDVYYLLDINDPSVEIDKAGWHKSGEFVSWNILRNYPRLANGIGSIFDIKSIPKPNTGFVVMNSPQTISITWFDNWWPLIGVFFVGAAGLWIGKKIISFFKWLSTKF